MIILIAFIIGLILGVYKDDIILRCQLIYEPIACLIDVIVESRTYKGFSSVSRNNLMTIEDEIVSKAIAEMIDYTPSDEYQLTKYLQRQCTINKLT